MRVLIVDDDPGIRKTTRIAVETAGHTAAEAVGRSLDLIIPENLRKRHWDGYGEVMAAGKTRYETGLLTSPGIRKDGVRLSLEFSMILLRNELGGMEGCASIMRDVTERWSREKELRERLTACEKNLAGSGGP